ncbi:MFS transporter [Streptomyces liangshanensis]|uniref:MFS transporter n=1 Tax=Streptomyces liangshanensis TaxID=2717324 RepID=A0A6G9GUM2_9ACTN|nr:MFS transporter [Streptomyces liangshanensis]QIQ01894.1 MFS transporter [Streptomyces liangshanensis]
MSEDDGKRAGGLRRLLTDQSIDTRPLSLPAFRRLFIGQGTSFIGSMLTQVAVPVQVFDLSHSSLDVGMVGLAGLVPLIVFGLYGGAVADAVDRRTLYLWSSLGTWAVTLALLAQTLLGVGHIGLILALVAAQSAGFAIASSARGAIIPRLVEPGLIPAANTLNYVVGTIGEVLGPLVAGVLVTLPHGFAYAYGADAVLFTAALYSTLRLPSIPPDGVITRIGLRSVGDGLKFIAGRPVLVMSFLVDLCAMVMAMPRSLFPAVALERFHGSVGLLYAAIPIGSVVAGFGSAWIGRVRRQGAVLAGAVIAWGAAVAVSGVAPQLWLVVVFLAVAGAADLISAVLRQTLLQTYAPDAMRGRLQGVYTVVVAGGPRLGDLRAGAMAVAFSASMSWTLGGVACVVAVAIGAPLARSFWRYDAAKATGGDVLREQPGENTAATGSVQEPTAP